MKWLLITAACIVLLPVMGVGDERISLSVAEGAKLQISSPGHDSIFVKSPVVGEVFQLGGQSARVSFGPDANGLLAATITSSDKSLPLHLEIAGKKIDADQAVVTLVFAADGGVTIDPGYVGHVLVDSHPVLAHDMVAENPQGLPPLGASPSQTSNLAPVLPAEASPTPLASTTDVVAPNAEKPASVSTSSASTFSGAPPTLASQLTSPLDSTHAATAPVPPASSTPIQVNDVAATSTQPVAPAPPLYWAEPVTAPDGSAPTVGLNEIKLVEVHGDVVVVSPTGEAVAGTEGMLVASGSTVRALDNASAALFMGGINSARLMPQCELVVTQDLQDAVRKTTLDLRRGAVFTRVGSRTGETQDYQIHTPEGSSSAETHEMLSFRGNPEDLQGTKTVLRSGLVLDRRYLLADLSVSNRHITHQGTDTPSGIPAPGRHFSTYFYYPNSIQISVGDVRHLVFGGLTGGTNFIAAGQPDNVLQAILRLVQPFNSKLNLLLARVNNGQGSASDVSYYRNLIKVFFDQQIPGLIDKYKGDPLGFAKALAASRQLLRQDIAPFGTNALTPF